MYSFNLLREGDITIIECIHKIFCGKATVSSWYVFIQFSAVRRCMLPLNYLFLQSSARRRYYLHTIYSYNLLPECGFTFIQCIHTIFCGKSILPSYNVFIQSSAGSWHYLQTMYSYNILREGDITII